MFLKENMFKVRFSDDYQVEGTLIIADNNYDNTLTIECQYHNADSDNVNILQNVTILKAILPLNYKI